MATPLAYLVARTAGAGWADVAPLVLRTRTLELAVNSLLLALGVAAGCLVLGVPTACLVTRARLPWPGLWRVLAALPLAVPSYVAAYAWVAWVPGIDGYLGAWLVLVLVSTPYVTLPVAAALLRADRGVEDAARTLGRSGLGAVWSAVLPQVAPAAAAGALLAALYALADFGAVAIMRYEAFTYGIQQAYRVGFDRILAAVLALLLTALAASLVLAERALRGSTARRQPPATAARTSDPARLGPWTAVAAGGLAVVAAAGLGVPVVVLIQRLLTGTGTLEWPDLVSATAATVTVSAAGALLTVALALPVGVLAARYSGPAVATVESASYLGHALPGIVVGLAMVFVTLTLVPGLYQTAAALACAYAVMFLPKAVGAVRTGVAQVPVPLEDAARTLGRGPVSVWATVTARAATPAVAAGGLLVMLTAMKELPATLLLRPLGMETLATELWSHTSVNAYGAAAPYAVALMLLAALPAYALSRQEPPT